LPTLGTLTADMKKPRRVRPGLQHFAGRKRYVASSFGPRHFLRHHASRPPLAKIRPGRPAPKAGAGIPTVTVAARISPPLLIVPPLTILKISEVPGSGNVGNANTIPIDLTKAVLTGGPPPPSLIGGPKIKFEDHTLGAATFVIPSIPGTQSSISCHQHHFLDKAEVTQCVALFGAPWLSAARLATLTSHSGHEKAPAVRPGPRRVLRLPSVEPRHGR
jgi:hypothetical protein